MAASLVRVVDFCLIADKLIWNLHQKSWGKKESESFSFNSVERDDRPRKRRPYRFEWLSSASISHHPLHDNLCHPTYIHARPQKSIKVSGEVGWKNKRENGPGRKKSSKNHWVRSNHHFNKNESNLPGCIGALKRDYTPSFCSVDLDAHNRFPVAADVIAIAPAEIQSKEESTAALSSVRI